MLAGCAVSEVPSPAASRITMVTSGDPALVAKTYAWHPTLFAVHTANKMDEDALRIHFRQAVDNVMTAKGYRLVNLEQMPQMTVGFGLALESAMSDVEILAKVGLVPGLSTQGVDKAFEKGSVLIALFPAKVERPFWQVLAQGFTEPSRDIEDREARFEHLAQIMLNGLPDVN
ncbi:DUF4136 domain-containing protein [Shewanella aestuarii]|uniref:DUF4136 domain-containing protein n=1 Tax=Shewanella aestuarii TaxID=1028752 RepID=A0A6G9QQV8_9GAMM|nr:DUF4136 domain-containing protein [Shewanella aestuarii]